MKYNPDVHHRRSIRLKGYDYSKSGAYFITICTKNKVCVFCDTYVNNGVNVGAGHWPALRVNQYGIMVEQGWRNIPNIYPNVEIDEFVVMPNHFHGIIVIGNRHDDDGVVLSQRAGQCPAPTTAPGTRTANVGKSVGYIIGQFKSEMTKQIRGNGLVEFQWQRDFYERIIRDETELNRIRNYIVNNPINWGKDKNYKSGGHFK